MLPATAGQGQRYSRCHSGCPAIPCPARASASSSAPARDDACSARTTRCHQPYSDRGRPFPRLGHQRAGPYRDDSPATRSHHPSPRHDTSHAAAASYLPCDDVDMAPACTSTGCASVLSAPAPACLPMAAASSPPEDPPPSSSLRPGERASVAVPDYHLVDPRTGVWRSLTISKAGLPLSLGAVSFAFQASQGSARSPTDLLRHIGLLYRGRAHLRVWKDAATAAREVRRKVELRRPSSCSSGLMYSLPASGNVSPNAGGRPPTCGQPFPLASDTTPMGSPGLIVTTSRPPISLWCGSATASGSYLLPADARWSMPT